MSTPWLDLFVADCHARFTALPLDAYPRNYLLNRAVRPEDVPTYRIGYLDIPTAREGTPEFWTWLQRYGRDAFVFPLTDPFGAVTGLVLRGVSTGRYENYIVYPKELCPPCFGLHTALPVAYRSQRMVIVEGIFDYFAMRPYAEDLIATLTAIPSLALRRLMARYVSKVVCLTDMDAPGRRAAYRLAGMPVPAEFRKTEDKLRDRIVPPPFQVLIPAYSAHDPSDLAQQRKVDELMRLAKL